MMSCSMDEARLFATRLENDSEMFQALNWALATRRPTTNLFKLAVFNFSRAVSGSLSVFSLFGSLAIILTYLTCRDIRTRTRRILLAWSLVEIAKVLASGSNSSEYSLAWMLTYGYLRSASLLWPTAFLVHLHFSIVQNQLAYRQWKLVGLHVVCWVLPLISIGVFSLLSTFYTTELSERTTAVLEALLVRGELFALAGFIAMPLLSLEIGRHIKREALITGNQFVTMGANTAAVMADRKLALLPPAFFLFHFSSFACTCFAACFEQVETVSSCPGWLSFLQVFENAQGLFSGVLFCWLTTKVRESIIATFNPLVVFLTGRSWKRRTRKQATARYSTVLSANATILRLRQAYRNRSQSDQFDPRWQQQYIEKQLLKEKYEQRSRSCSSP